MSLTFHEFSHGYVAFLLGDDTAKRRGRLSFNPLRHLDLVGTLFIIFFHFGWAKPVPVNPANFTDPRKHMMFVALAGPAANLVIAFVGAFFLRMVFKGVESNVVIFDFLCVVVLINVMLAMFNLLPIFPLDGSSILKGLLPQEGARFLANLDRYAAILLISIFILDSFLKIGIFSRILLKPVMFVVEFLTQEAFPAFLSRL